MAGRWEQGQVLSLAPDASAERAARSLATARSWLSSGCDEERGAVWGECKGSAATPYRTAVDLTGPAYKCSCPSRKFPCKHALGLLLNWANGAVPEAGTPADFAASWLADRSARAEKAEK